MYLKTNAVNIYFDDRGSGCPLLCLHAFPVDSTIWRAQYPLATQVRLIVPDLRGMGRSETPAHPSRMELLAADMVALLDHLSIERAVVMGLSLGGYVALAMYRLFANRVRGLILADTRAEADSQEAREGRLRAVNVLRKEGVATLPGALPNLFGTTTRREHPELIEEELHHAAEADAEGLALMLLGMAERPDSGDLLPTINVPTLVLCGEEDTVSPPDGMRAMAKQIPTACFHTIPNAGHLSPLENPEAFNWAVQSFLDELP